MCEPQFRTRLAADVWDRRYAAFFNRCKKDKFIESSFSYQTIEYVIGFSSDVFVNGTASCCLPLTARTTGRSSRS